MAKYYVCNDIRFLGGDRAIHISPSAGTHLKQSKAVAFLKTHPGYGYCKVRNTSKGNDYVICTSMKFVGHNNNIVNNFRGAKSFDSVDEAYECLKQVEDEDVIYVVDDNFARKKTKTKDDIPEAVENLDPLDSISFEGMDTSERVYIPKRVRKIIYDREEGICPICGKPLHEYAYNIDHHLPLSKGGTNNPHNLHATHEYCNCCKDNLLEEDFKQVVMDVAAYELLKNPFSIGTAIFFRAFVRGVIRKNDLCQRAV